MKKKLLLLGVIGFLTVNVFADHPGNKLGLGLFLGGGWGSVGGGVFNPGISLKVPKLPVFWGFNASIGNTSSLSASADYYIFDADLVKDGSFDLDWFLGVGIFASMYFSDNPLFAVGARIPVGLSWHINNTFELFGDLVPGLGLRFTSNPLYGIFAAELGLRVWL
jgi:hypothetical protein